jgi:hypothetical protein
MANMEDFANSAENFRIGLLISEARRLAKKVWTETDFNTYSHQCVRDKVAEIEAQLGWAILRNMNVAEAFANFDLTLDDNT